MRTTETERKPTLRDIAEATGVSHMTVSRVFSGHGTVAKKTREKIIRVSNKMGFSPHPLARGLNGGRTMTLGLVWSLLGPHDRVALANQIAAMARRQGYMTFTADHSGACTSVREVLRRYLSHGVDGVIIDELSCFMDDRESMELLGRFPAVVATSQRPVDTFFDLIELDRTPALGAAVDHVIAAGRRRIGYLSYNDPILDTKLEAIRSQLQRHSLECTEPLHIPVALSAPPAFNGGDFTDALDRLVPGSVPFPFDTLICCEDEAALVVIDWLRQRSLTVPGDVSVIGFNNSPICPYTSPPLASIERSNERLVPVIGRMMTARLADPDLPPQRERLEMQYVPRRSAGKRSKKETDRH
jgi:DNA-binding LacI/PurR family transcriptional regulator